MNFPRDFIAIAEERDWLLREVARLRAEIHSHNQRAMAAGLRNWTIVDLCSSEPQSAEHK